MVNKDKIRLCFVSGVISRSGGTERVGSIIANQLSCRGYDVFLLSFWNQGPPYYTLDKEVHVNYLLNHKIEGKLYRTGIYSIIRLHNFIKNNNIDILIDIDTVLSRHSAYAIQGTKCKLISWEHFNYWTMLKLKEKRRFRAKKLVKKKASKLVVLTEQDKKAHIDYLGFEPNRVMVMPNPCMEITDKEYCFSTHVFLAVGRLTNPKGFDLLLDAWHIVENQVEDWKLIIVGSGEDEDMLKELMNRYKLKNVIFAGHTNDVNEFYTKAACYVLSSRYEGFPMVLLEAEANGLPVISFDCKTGPRDLILNQKTGYLVEDKNIQALADAMIAFTKDEKYAKKMSYETKKFVSQFKLSEIIDKWEILIDEVLNEEAT